MACLRSGLEEAVIKASYLNMNGTFKKGKVINLKHKY